MGEGGGRVEGGAGVGRVEGASTHTNIALKLARQLAQSFEGVRQLTRTSRRKLTRKFAR